MPLCFVIEGKELYLDKVLVEYNELPIFFICKSEQQYFAVLCVDLEQTRYIIVEVTLRDISRMLHGKLTMRETISKQSSFWEVVSGDSMDEDVVVFKEMTEIAKNELPYEDSYFCIVTSDMQEYLNKVDTKLYIGIYYTLKPMKLNENILDRGIDYAVGDFCIEVERYTQIFEKALMAEFVQSSKRQLQYWKEDIIVAEPMVLNFSGNVPLEQVTGLEESSFLAA